MEISKSLILYLKTIYELKNNARVTTIADYLNYSKPSVVRALKNLKKQNLINYEEKITLTEKGMRYALNITRRDKILKKFFTEILEIDEVTASIDASNMKDNISCYTIKKLEDYICNTLKVDVNEETNYCICEFEDCSSCKH